MRIPFCCLGAFHVLTDFGYSVNPYPVPVSEWRSCDATYERLLFFNARFQRTLPDHIVHAATAVPPTLAALKYKIAGYVSLFVCGKGLVTIAG